MSQSNVADSIRFWRAQRPALVINLSTLPVLGFFLWGVTDWRRCTVWSIAALAQSFWVFRKGWIPWRMPLYETYVGRESNSRSEAELAATRFFRDPKRRLRGGAITATAALTPWIGAALSLLFHLTPLGVKPREPLPVWAFAFFGFMDAIRSSSLAMNFWLSDASRELAYIDEEPDRPEMARDFGTLKWWLRARKMSWWRFAGWVTVGLIVAIILKLGARWILK